MRKLTRFIVALTALALIAAGCGGDDDTTATATTDTTEDADGGMDMDMDDGDHMAFEFGEPADVADADRTIEVDMADDFTYDPDSIEVSVGETIAFEVRNSGRIVHEFVIGDMHIQEEHEQEMQEMEGSMMMEDEPNAVAVEPGDTKTLAFRFTEPGDLEYACHQPGHYAAGMTAPLTVS